MTLNSKILRGLFEYERLRPAIIKTIQGNVPFLPHLKEVLNIGIRVDTKVLKILC